MTDKRNKRPPTDPAQAALEAANQALAAANAAVQAAVKALALSRDKEAKDATGKRGSSIRKAASQARRSAETGARGKAPLATPAQRRHPAGAEPPVMPRPAQEAPAPASVPVEVPAAVAPQAELEPPAAVEPEPAASAAVADVPVEAAPEAGAVVEEVPEAAAVVEEVAEAAAVVEEVLEADAVVEEIQGAGPPVEEARQWPMDAGPIMLGPSSAPAAPAPVVDGARAAEPSAAAEPPPAWLEDTDGVRQVAEAARAAVEAEDVARRDAELRQRETELAEREAAMARYAPLEPARAVPARPQSEPNGIRVLVVDDEEQVRALTVRILSRFGYEVIEAPGVEQAMAALDDHDHGVDLVLSDVAMPGLSGKDLYRKIAETRPGLPVVFMSGYALGVYAPEGLIEEGVKLLPKPFTQEDLLGFVTEALAGAAAR